MKERGCMGPATSIVGFSFDPGLKRCPWATYKPEAFAVVRLHRAASGPRREMPFGGRFEDQPLWVGQAFRIIDDAIEDAKGRAAKKQEAEIARIRESIGKG